MIGIKRIAGSLIVTVGALAAAALTTAGASGGPAGDDPTYHKDILPIFQRHCLSCHNAAGTASTQILDDYRLGRSWFRTSKTQLEEGKMPPWYADPAVGSWKNAPEMTEEEVATIAAWVDARAPEGDAADAPDAIDYTAEWKMGEPDRTLAMAEPFKLPAFGEEAYRAFVLEPAFEADTWVRGIELNPGNLEVVYDMSLSIAPSAAARAADAADEGPGFAAFDRGAVEGAADDVALWTRGIVPVEPLPEGVGVLIPAGSSLILRVHYVSADEEREDLSSVGLHLAEGPADKQMKSLAVENREFEIPADSYGHEVTAELTLETGIEVHAILPRMFYLGDRMELTAHLPGGESRPLLRINGHNYKLQAVYQPSEPIALPAGTRLEATATYENNYDNLNNPNLSVKKAVHGAAPLNEVMSVVLQYTEAGAAPR